MKSEKIQEYEANLMKLERELLEAECKRNEAQN